MRILISQKMQAYIRSNNYSSVCMTRGKDRRISIFPEEEWKRQEHKFELMFTDTRERKTMSKLFMQNYTRLNLEGRGYSTIDIPDELERWAGIDSDVVILARRNRIEIWSKNNYDLFCKDSGGVVLGGMNICRE